MSEEGPHIDSRSWTGDLPGPTTPKPVTAFQMKLLLGLFLYAICHSAWAIFDGLTRGLIMVPLQKWHHWVSMDNRIAFAACVAGWVLILAIAALGAVGSTSWLRKKRSS